MVHFNPTQNVKFGIQAHFNMKIMLNDSNRNILTYGFRFSYYIAGSSDVGPTMLESSMHLLAEDCLRQRSY